MEKDEDNVTEIKQIGSKAWTHMKPVSINRKFLVKRNSFSGDRNLLRPYII